MSGPKVRVTTVTFYRAFCTCGWVGNVEELSSTANGEGDRHKKTCRLNSRAPEQREDRDG